MPKRATEKPVNELSSIVQRVGAIRQQRSELDEEENDVLWPRFGEIADDTAGALESYRYFDPALELGMAREMHKNTPRVDVAALQAMLSPAQWKLITRQERVFDMELLTVAVAAGKIPKATVDDVTESKPPTPHRKFIDKPTKLDQAAIKRYKRQAGAK